MRGNTREQDHAAQPFNADEPLSIAVEQAKLSDEDRLSAAKSLVVAASQLCPIREDAITPTRVELANTMLGAVHALLHTQAERDRAQWWAALQEQQVVGATHGLH